MDTSDPVRMGCISHIAMMCKKAMEFKLQDESKSLESLSSSAIGYMCEVLISQSWPNFSGNAAGVTRQKTLTLLSCLQRAPRLPKKDWRGCLRRCMRLYPHDGEIHTAVVRFVCERAVIGTLDNLREFVIIDIFDLLRDERPFESTYFAREAQYLALTNIHVIVRYLSHEESSKTIRSLVHLFTPETCNTQQLAHAVCCGLYSLSEECSDSMMCVTLDVMVKIMFNIMDCSPASINMFCSLYPLQNHQILGRIVHDRSGESLIDEIEIQTDIAALMIAAYRIASPEIQRAFCQSTEVFSRNPELHTWLSCALMSFVDIITATTQCRNYILTQETDVETLSRILAEGFRNALVARGQTMNNGSLAWVTTLVGTHYTNGKVPERSMHTAIMCLVGIYAAQTNDWSLSLSFHSATRVLPKALDFFIQQHGDAFSDIAQIFITYMK